MTVSRTDAAKTVAPAEGVSAPGIERVTGLSAQDFRRRFLKPLRPVVITDAIDQWPARRRWSTAYLASEYGDLEVVADVPIDRRDIEGTDHPESKIKTPEKLHLRMRELIRQLEASDAQHPAPYLRNVDLDALSPALAAEIEPRLAYARPNWLTSRFLPRNWICRDGLVELFIGGVGSSFPFLHYDQAHTHAFIVQLHGQKEVTLFAPDQTPYLYPDQFYVNNSIIPDIDDVDLDRFPLFAKAEPIRLTVGPGETLFVPSGWWHTTRMPGPSISVSTNNVNRFNWWAFARDVYRERRASSALKAAMVYGYLWAAGSMMGLLELFGL